MSFWAELLNQRLAVKGQDTPDLPSRAVGAGSPSISAPSQQETPYESRILNWPSLDFIITASDWKATGLAERSLGEKQEIHVSVAERWHLKKNKASAGWCSPGLKRPLGATQQPAREPTPRSARGGRSNVGTSGTQAPGSVGLRVGLFDLGLGACDAITGP